MSLQNQKVIIVGGSSGIGFGVAAELLSRGAEVVLVGRSAEKLKRAQERLGSESRVRVAATDARQEDQVVQLFATIGTFDHLVTTSGILPYNAPIGAVDATKARELIDTIMMIPLLLTKHSQGRLRTGGSITFTSGISKDRPGPGGAVVAAAAGSLSYLARALALELGPTRVNVVSPGWVDTPMWDAIVGEAKKGMWEQMGKRLPAGRIASPADVAKAYVYLIESELTTGTTLSIDGGHALI
ncbi:short chain dehydrogenase [Opitutaceae bacterium EW11]|nr:short chain dehydrogenase [Opitutaceae bacterium EW11]